MKKLRAISTLITLAGLALLLFSPSAGADESVYAPKLAFRFSNGLLINEGTSGGSGTTIGALNPMVLWYLGPRFALGIGYWADLDITHSNLPLSGLDVSGRWYFSGAGTRTTFRSETFTHTFQSKVKFYCGAEFSQRSYYNVALTSSGTNSNNGNNNNNSSTSTSTNNGSYLTLNALLGGEISLGPNLELNAEFDSSLMSFAASNPTVRIQAMILNLGVNFVW